VALLDEEVLQLGVVEVNNVECAPQHQGYLLLLNFN
jgi:hypothetical protein